MDVSGQNSQATWTDEAKSVTLLEAHVLNIVTRTLDCNWWIYHDGGSQKAITRKGSESATGKTFTELNC